MLLRSASVATLFCLETKLGAVETQGPLDEALSPIKLQEHKVDDTIAYWSRGRKGLPSRIPLGHMAVFEWMQRSNVESSDPASKEMDGGEQLGNMDRSS